ncbi:hypothetical protein [Saccharothrix variisporea]|nr:hypothetical protein [Saccharothrix variisporea]
MLGLGRASVKTVALVVTLSSTSAVFGWSLCSTAAPLRGALPFVEAAVK